MYGSDGWTRTSDPWINSPLLYQLSYIGIEQTARPGNDLLSGAPAVCVKRILVEDTGFEPVTSCMPCKRSPN